MAEAGAGRMWSGPGLVGRGRGRGRQDVVGAGAGASRMWPGSRMWPWCSGTLPPIILVARSSFGRDPRPALEDVPGREEQGEGRGRPLFWPGRSWVALAGSTRSRYFRKARRRYASYHSGKGTGKNAAEARRCRAGGTTVGVTLGLGVLAGTLVGAPGDTSLGQGSERGGRRGGERGRGRGRGRRRRRQRGQSSAEPLPPENSS